jgi:hypothetical protein
MSKTSTGLKPCKAENVDRGSSFSVPIDLIGGCRWPGAPKLNSKLAAMILRAEIGAALGPMTAITSAGRRGRGGRGRARG